MDGGPEGFVDGLLEALGPQGTLLLSAFTIPSYVPSAYVYDPSRTPA